MTNGSRTSRIAVTLATTLLLGAGLDTALADEPRSASPLASAAGSPAPAPDDAATAFARLEELVGTWDEAEYGRVVQYRLTGDGTALIEEWIGDPYMATVYHRDGPDIRLTHYCNAGNQPRMRASTYDEATAMLAFDFVDVTSLASPEAYHTRLLTMHFLDADRVVLNFTGLRNGEEMPTTHTLTRRPGTTATERSLPLSNDDADRPELDPEAAFAWLESALVGEWRGRLLEIDEPVEATFYLTGNGSALVEDIRRPEKPGSRMHTVYHLADSELRLTHYCSFRNQPRLVARSVSDDGRTIVFELLDVTNLSRSGDRYTHRMVVSLSGDDRASITYVGVDDGHEGTVTAQLTKVRPVGQ